MPNSKITYERVHGQDVSEEDEHAATAEHDDDSPLLVVSGRRKQQGPRNKRKYLTACWLVTLVLVAAAAASVSGAACFIWGRRFERDRAESDWFSPPGRIDRVFKYRRPFSERPSNNESQIWWDRVFPRGRGFIQHPDISPVPHGLAVFHQLHCLDAIRHGYWAAVDGIEPAHHAKPGHIRHCIDYLRQSIMCNADTNLEPIDPDLGGVTGWGFTRKCRDIVRLIGWAQKWRTHNQTGHH